MIKYYGGKKWLSKRIKDFIPKEKCERFVDLFVGGGSITDVLCEVYDSVTINDKDENLINFYQVTNDTPMVDILSYFISRREETTFDDVKTFRKKLMNDCNVSDLERAFLYYSCIYCGYGGKPYASPTRDKFNNYKRRDIEKDLEFCKKTLSMCDIVCEDYHDVVYQNSFYYCDPPYAKVGDNTYYGQLGCNHKEFNHIEFFKYISKIAINNKVMISYEDSEYIRELYKGWNIVGLNKKTVNYNPSNGDNETLQTNELLIMNY